MYSVYMQYYSITFGGNLFGMNKASMIFNPFLKFGRFELGDSYKLDSYKKVSILKSNSYIYRKFMKTELFQRSTKKSSEFFTLCRHRYLFKGNTKSQILCWPQYFLFTLLIFEEASSWPNSPLKAKGKKLSKVNKIICLYLESSLDCNMIIKYLQ